jgi:hypothetical protein
MQKQEQMKQLEQYHMYSRKALAFLLVVCAIGLLLFLIGLFAWLSNVATSGTSVMGWAGFGTLLIGSIIVMAIDWRGAVTVRGTVPAYMKNVWAKSKYAVSKDEMISTASSYVLCYIFFPMIIFPIYLIRVLVDCRKAKQEHEQKWRYQVASLEAQLGILPATEGECRVCHKPLVVGAEFCQYCGTPAIERPKICPVCATTALPDAKFCPKCRAALP